MEHNHHIVGSQRQAAAAPTLSGAVIDFGKHALAGIAIFLIVGASAVGLDLLVRHLVTLEVSEWVIVGLHVVEMALFVADVALLLIFLIRGGIRAARFL
jgi:hypothetical protein